MVVPPGAEVAELRGSSASLHPLGTRLVRKALVHPSWRDSVRRVGYVLIALAMVGYAVAVLFVDFYSGEFPGTPKITYFDLLTSPGPTSAVDTIGGILTAFGGPLLIVVLALVGLAGRDTAARPLVIVAVAVWALFVVGVTLGIWASRDDFPVGTGFWVQATCAGIAIVGMLVLLLLPDRAASPAVDTASDGMRT